MDMMETQDREIKLTYHKERYIIELFANNIKPYMLFKLTQREAESLFSQLEPRLRSRIHYRTELN